MREKDELELYFEERAKNDPEFKQACKELETEELMTLSMLKARESAGMTQAALASVSGIDQGNISRIESGNGNPSISTLKRIAEAINSTLKIEFVPKQTISR